MSSSLTVGGGASLAPEWLSRGSVPALHSPVLAPWTGQPRAEASALPLLQVFWPRAQGAKAWGGVPEVRDDSQGVGALAST